MSDSDSHQPHAWSVPRPIVERIVLGLYALCALSVLADLWVDRHEKLGFAESFGFYAWYGFVACVGLVVAAKQMRRLIMRREDYYGEAND